MRQLKYISVVFGTALLLSACSNNNSAVTQLVNSQIKAETGTDIIAESNQEAAGDINDTASAETESASAEAVSTEAAATTQLIPETPAADSDVDVDLTRMSGTMVYSQVYDMLMYPERYVGKTVRVSGEYYASYWEETDTYYQYVIVADAAACCEQGLEFIWDEGTRSYPEDYPEDFTPVEIVGTFAMYEEGEYEYCYLATDDLTVR